MRMNKNVYRKLLDALIFLTIILLPWQARLIYDYHVLNGQIYEYGVFSIYVSSIILLAAVVVLQAQKEKAIRLSLSAVTLFFVLLLSALFSDVVVLAKHYIVLFALAMMYMYIAYAWDRKRVMGSVIIMGIVQSMFAWYQFFTQKIEASTMLGVAEHIPSVLGQSVVSIYGVRYLRAYGLLPHPNILGGVLAVSFGFAIYAFVHYKQERDTRHHLWFSYIASILFLFSGLLLTFSRSALIAIAAFLVFWAIRSAVKSETMQFKRITQVIAVSLALFFSFNVIASNVWWQRLGISNTTSFEYQTELDERSYDERVSEYGDALRLMSFQTVTIGLGMGNYTSHLAAMYPLRPVYEYQPVHNSYMMMVLEIGLLGTLSFAWFLLSLLRARRQGDKTASVHPLPVSMLGIILILALFDHYIWTSYSGLSLFWLTFGFVINRYSD